MATKPRILVYDLEVSPTLGWSYGIYDTRIIRTEQEPIIMSFSYRWYGEKKTHHVRLIDDDVFTPSQPNNDAYLAEKLRDLFHEADVVIAHNANRFDNKIANMKFLQHDIAPPSPYKTVDTLRVARSVARFNSNSLSALGEALGIGGKSKVTHSDIWYDCLKGDKKAWDKLRIYNNQDVDLLYKLYEKLRPYIKNHPNLGDLTQTDGICPKCGSFQLKKEGTHARRAGRVQSYSCLKCGGWTVESKLKSNGRLVNA